MFFRYETISFLSYFVKRLELCHQQTYSKGG